MKIYDQVWDLFLSESPDFPTDEDKEAEGSDAAVPVKLNEWQEYFVKFYGDIPLQFIEDARFKDKASFPGNIYLIRFKNAVGLTRLGGLKIDINNRKIGNRQFRGMLDYLTDRYPALVADLSFEKSVGHRFDKGSKVGRDRDYLQLLFLQRFLGSENQIEGLVNAILRDPHRQLRQEVISLPMEAITQPDPLLALAGMSDPQNLAQLPAEHPLTETALARTLFQRTGKSLFPVRLPTLRRYHCVDTHENRFIKHVMQQVERQLSKIEADSKDSYLNPDLSETLHTLKEQLATALEDPFWREIGRLRLVPHSSQVLHRKEGYRQFFQLHALLQLLTRQDFQLFDFEHLLDTKDSALLYEYWCFLVVKEVVDDICGPAIATSLVEGDAERWDIEEGLRIEYCKGVSLTYNRNCLGPQRQSMGKSYSHTLRPDIIIQCLDALLVLDAKNKINGKPNGNSFGEENQDHSITRAKHEDIDKMHCYRDAIIGVIGAFALFPGTEWSIYPIADDKQQWQGVGAWPLRPKADATVDPEHRRRLTSFIKGFIHAHAQLI